MGEELAPHIALHHRAHHVPLIIDEHAAQRMRSDQDHHDGSHEGDIRDGIGRLRSQQALRDVPDTKR